MLNRCLPEGVLVSLLSLGVTHLHDVLSLDNKWVISAEDLKRKYGKGRVKTKHVHALHKLAAMLHEYPASLPSKPPTKQEVEEKGLRRIAEEYIAYIGSPQAKHAGQITMYMKVVQRASLHCKQRPMANEQHANKRSKLEDQPKQQVQCHKRSNMKGRMRAPGVAGHREALDTCPTSWQPGPTNGGGARQDIPC